MRRLWGLAHLWFFSAGTPQLRLPHRSRFSGKLETDGNVHQFPFVEELGNAPRFPENRHLLYFLFQLPNPFLQELPLWFLLGQRQRLLIRRLSLSCPAEPAVHICAGGMRQVIICQFAMFQHRVDMRQTGFWTIAHRDCNGTIELYNRRRLNSYQSVVKRNNLPPVGRSDRFRLRMNGRNRSLQCVGAEVAGLPLVLQGSLQQCHSLRDLLPVPERTILALQQNQLSGRRGSRGVTGFL